MKLYTTKTVAYFLDVTPRRVRQLRDSGVLTEVRPGLYDIVDAAHRYVRYLRQRNPDSGEVLDYNTERAKLVQAKRQNEEYDLQRKEEKLHSSEDVERVLGQMLTNFRARLMGIPSRLASVLSEKTDPVEIFQLMKQDIEEALLELSDFDTLFRKEEPDEGGNG